MCYGLILTWNLKITAKIPFDLILLKKLKSSSRSGQKRSNFWHFEILKKFHVSDAEWAQESNGAISFYVGQIELPEISFLYMSRHNLA